MSPEYKKSCRTCMCCKNNRQLRSFESKRHRVCIICKRKRRRPAEIANREADRVKARELRKVTPRACSTCKEVKQPSEFYTHRASECRKCHIIRCADNVKKNPERHKQYVLNWNKNNPEKLKEIQRLIAAKYVTECHDVYLTACINHRVHSKIKINKNNRDKHRELLDKQKEKLLLEREITTLVRA
jgi:hypothetical protein